MSEKSLRGTRLGASSLESETGVEPVERHLAEYHCPHGHVFTVPFAFDADVPPLWECRRCGAEALLADATRPQPRTVKPVRTHWDMLLERRSIADLEILLDERLALLRAKQGGGGQAHKRSA
jgi:RNA polymerase-binding protein